LDGVGRINPYASSSAFMWPVPPVRAVAASRGQAEPASSDAVQATDGSEKRGSRSPGGYAPGAFIDIKV
jgi:hypothetical protein